jgi:tRNA-specific 2-thiouridylase
MFNEYGKGRTPNPDILCNREIKFDVFLSIALSLGADYVATGHYCQKSSFQTETGNRVYQLLAGKDYNKDQSYFLCQLNQAQLEKVLFPIGHLQKAEVRAIAQREQLVTAEKKDSQGLCFIGKVSLPDFLQQQLKPKTGQIVKIPETLNTYKSQSDEDQTLVQKAKKYHYNTSDGTLVGEHQGAHFYTIGQRKGLGIGGFEAPLFVIDTDVAKNIIYVGEGKSHPGLYRDTLKVSPEEVHWIRTDVVLRTGDSLEVLARIRYRQPLQKATLFHTQEGLYITFEESQSAITPGQFVAWYLDNELLGSGVIA